MQRSRKAKSGNAEEQEGKSTGTRKECSGTEKKMTYRDHTKVIRIGDRVIGGGNPILIQSMTNTPTEDVEATVAQILRLEEAGCEIIRCTCPSEEAALAIGQIKKRIHIPLVADIHFDYKMAIRAMENGADKIRINPGNIGGREKIEAVVNVAKERQVPIRVGVNSGSLEKELVAKYGWRVPWTRSAWWKSAVMTRWSSVLNPRMS